MTEAEGEPNCRLFLRENKDLRRNYQMKKRKKKSFNDVFIRLADEERRYGTQQELLERIAAKLGVVAFRPRYHHKKEDPNTVLFYTKEAAAYNRELDAKYGSDAREEDYRPYFWRFQNTDVNGLFSYNFANRGELDLRIHRASEKLEAVIALALARQLEWDYLKACGGRLSEADETHNDLNRNIIAAYAKVYPNACIGRINLDGPAYTAAREEGKYRFEKFTGQKVCNFGADFIIPSEDRILRQALVAWAQEAKLESLNAIDARISAVRGIRFLWS